MIKLKQKPFEEIADSIAKYDAVLNIGCGGCASVCLAGGQREIVVLNAQLDRHFKRMGQPKRLAEYTLERACNSIFFPDLDQLVSSYDCLISMACSAGVQFIAERYQHIPVYPAINTHGIGVDRELGVYEEVCKGCGQCVIGYTGGICPLTNCAKKLFNGPCGGTNDGSCEVSGDVPCAWHAIYTRLHNQGRLEDIFKIHPVMEWRDQVRRRVVQEEYRPVQPPPGKRFR